MGKELPSAFSSERTLCGNLIPSENESSQTRFNFCQINGSRAMLTELPHLDQSWTRRGRKRRQCIPIQGSRCCVFSGGRRASGAHLPSARCRLHDRQQGRQWQVRLADNSNRAGSRVVCSRARGNRGDIGPAQRAMALKHCVENPQLAQSIYELRILGG